MKCWTEAAVPAIRDYLKTKDAVPRTPRKAVILDEDGGYNRTAGWINFADDGTVTASSSDLLPDEATQKAIKEAADLVPVMRLVLPDKENLRELLANVKCDEFYRYPNFVVLRSKKPGGRKVDIPWSYWSDGESEGVWHSFEPDELGFYNQNAMEEKDVDTVFIHEGSKAAQGITDQLEKGGHPWQSELTKGTTDKTKAVHVGYHGGPFGTDRSNWDAISKSGIHRVIIVADNDDTGREAPKRISRHLKCQTLLLQFDDYFPKKFDLADPFPVFEDRKPPTFRSLIVPATWLTKRVIVGTDDKPKSVIKLRKCAEKDWLYVRNLDIFVWRYDRKVQYREKNLQNALRSYCDNGTKNIAALIAEKQKRATYTLDYRPDLPGQLFVDGEGGPALNTYEPPAIKPVKGSVKRFLDYIKHLIPDKKDRLEVLRWVATLIAKPERRIGYALLLISVQHGTGKSTCATQILRPLVGPHNYWAPQGNKLRSNFNSWSEGIRLVVFEDTNAGSSWDAYQKLKPLITEPYIEIERKGLDAYMQRNFVHVFITANSYAALKMENADRRWLIPRVTEEKKDRQYWVELRRWLLDGGLGNILHWATTQPADFYIEEGEHAPETNAKQDMIQSSESAAKTMYLALAEAIRDYDGPVAIGEQSIRHWISGQIGKPLMESAADMRRAGERHGGLTMDFGDPKQQRIKAKGTKQYVIGNAAMQKLLNVASPKDRAAVVRQDRYWKDPSDVAPM